MAWFRKEKKPKEAVEKQTAIPEGLWIKCDECKEIVDRKSTRLNSSHSQISYAVFCLKKKTHYQPCCSGYTHSWGEPQSVTPRSFLPFLVRMLPRFIPAPRQTHRLCLFAPARALTRS